MKLIKSERETCKALQLHIATTMILTIVNNITTKRHLHTRFQRILTMVKLFLQQITHQGAIPQLPHPHLPPIPPVATPLLLQAKHK